jgi:hypothetical protein
MKIYLVILWVLSTPNKGNYIGEIVAFSDKEKALSYMGVNDGIMEIREIIVE